MVINYENFIGNSVLGVEDSNIWFTDAFIGNSEICLPESRKQPDWKLPSSQVKSQVYRLFQMIIRDSAVLHAGNSGRWEPYVGQSLFGESKALTDAVYDSGAPGPWWTSSRRWPITCWSGRYALLVHSLTRASVKRSDECRCCRRTGN